MRIAIGQLWQETNTLNPLSTTRADFEAFGVTRGAEMVSAMANTNELGGFTQSLRTLSPMKINNSDRGEFCLQPSLDRIIRSNVECLNRVLRVVILDNLVYEIRVPTPNEPTRNAAVRCLFSGGVA